MAFLLQTGLCSKLKTKKEDLSYSGPEIGKNLVKNFFCCSRTILTFFSNIAISS